MKKLSRDSLGSRMKQLEGHYQSYLMDGLPTIVRLDGRSFHTETRNLDRPFDSDFRWAMYALTLKAAHEFGATAAYTQSDEITLIINKAKPETQLPFGGRVDKICSLMASYVSVHFNKIIHDEFYKLNKKFEGRTPTFDCRVFQTPSQAEAANCFVWREQDAARNAIQQVGQSFFTHKELHKVNTKQLVEKLKQEKDVDFYSRYDYYTRMGHMVGSYTTVTGKRLYYLFGNIPGIYEFSLTKATNKVGVLFNSGDPEYAADNLPRLKG